MAEAELRFGADATQVLTEYQKIAAAEKMWRAEVAQTSRAIQQREDAMNKATNELTSNLQKINTEGTINIGKLASEWGVVEKAIQQVIKAGNQAVQQQKEAAGKLTNDLTS